MDNTDQREDTVIVVFELLIARVGRALEAHISGSVLVDDTSAVGHRDLVDTVVIEESGGDGGRRELAIPRIILCQLNLQGTDQDPVIRETCSPFLGCRGPV